MESRTRSLIQSAVSLGAVLVLAGCDDFLGLGDDVDVDVIAEANVDQNIISFTVVNRGPDTINYHGADLELRDGQGKWHQIDWPTIDLLPVLPIEPDETHTVSRPIIVDAFCDPQTIQPGMYRFKVLMTTNRNAVSSDMPGEVRTSNAVGISYFTPCVGRELDMGGFRPSST